MSLLQLAQFFGHLVGALLLLALFSHRAVTSLSACSTRASVRPPEPLCLRSAPCRDNGSDEGDESRDNRPAPAEKRLLRRSQVFTRSLRRTLRSTGDWRCRRGAGNAPGAPTLPCVSDKVSGYVEQPCCATHID